MTMHVASRRRSPAAIATAHPGAVVIDVTSRAPEPWVRLSPFYPHGGIPVPFSPGAASQSVEGIWQALKVFEAADVDPAKRTSGKRSPDMLERDRTTEPFDEREGFRDIVGLLPVERRDEPADFWDIGEQEGALETLVSALLDCRVPITGLARARLAALAEQWGTWDVLAGPLASCESAAEDAPLRLVERTDRGTAVEEELTREIGLGHPLTGLAAVAWFTCGRCDDVLIRVHENEPWGLSFTASQYAITRPTWSGGEEPYPLPTTVFFTTPYEAIDTLLDRCR
ncbi:DUF6939 family protein [Actinomadura scrupuli]|uniref:DUF6939 family protein n=1 Tax=Actinomadura scrupuli TaxID=559629 RepID=UPI003D999D60